MHIHIDRMDAIPDVDATLLVAAQSDLTYPWLRPSLLHSIYAGRAEQNSPLAFLQEFRSPLDFPPSPRQ
jgi:hypothetical protein